jgi:hypothetical protein
MPRKRIPVRPRHSHPELVQALADQMHVEGVSPTPDTPTIYEEEQPYGGNLYVKVIWNRWADVPLEERGAIILDAYERAGLSTDMRKIYLAVGLTPEEDERLKLD